MRARRLIIGVLLLGLAACSGSGPGIQTTNPGPGETASCDADCLKGVMDQYLAALVSKDVDSLPLAEDVRFTENSVPLAIGDALWGTATAIGDYSIYIPDPTAGQVAYLGVVEEYGTPRLFTARLKVDDGAISEIETIVSRSDNPQTGPDKLKRRPPFYEAVPADERRDRDALIAIANSYFEGIENLSSQHVPFHADCIRVENGMQTAGARETAGDGNAAGPQECGAQFDSGIFQFITEIHPRRFLAVDPEHGLVFGIFSFVHDGRKTEITLADGRTVDVPEFARHPNDVLIGELFKIEDGTIRQIEAVGVQVPYKRGTGWDE